MTCLVAGLLVCILSAGDAGKDSVDLREPGAVAVRDTIPADAPSEGADEATFLGEDPATIEAASWERQSAPPSLLLQESGGPSRPDKVTRPGVSRRRTGFVYIEAGVARTTGSSSMPEDSLLLGPPFSSILRVRVQPSHHWSGQFVAARQSGERISDAALRGSVCYASGQRTQLIVGDYLVNAGSGLVLSGSSVAVGEGVARSRRRRESIRQYFGAGTMGFLRGGILTQEIGLGPGVAGLTLLASQRSLAASIRDDGTVRSIDWSGYVRTAKETGKQAQLHETLLGGRCRWTRAGSYAVGLTWYRARFDRPIEAESGLGFAGDRSEVFGADAFVVIGQTALTGEVARSFDGCTSWVVGVMADPSSHFSIAVHLRSYAEGFSNPHAAAFGAHRDAGNEQGAFVGFSSQLLPAVRVEGSVDMSRFPGRTSGNRFPADNVRGGLQCTLGEGSGGSATVRVRSNHTSEVRIVDVSSDARRRLLTIAYFSLAGIAKIPLGNACLMQIRAMTAAQHSNLGLRSYRGTLLGVGARWRTESLEMAANLHGFTTDGSGASVSIVEQAPARGVSAVVCSGDGVRWSVHALWNPVPALKVSGWIGKTIHGWKPAMSDGPPDDDLPPLTTMTFEISLIL